LAIGFCDASGALSHPKIFERPDNPEGFHSFDFFRSEKSNAES
jgi:hypothetical protein